MSSNDEEDDAGEIVRAAFGLDCSAGKAGEAVVYGVLACSMIIVGTIGSTTDIAGSNARPHSESVGSEGSFIACSGYRPKSRSGG